jgi:hypothetical protein
MGDLVKAANRSFSDVGGAPLGLFVDVKLRKVS